MHHDDTCSDVAPMAICSLFRTYLQYTQWLLTSKYPASSPSPHTNGPARTLRNAFPVENPATDKVIAMIQGGNTETTVKAIEAAQKAFDKD
jgi:hypothetical protein